MLYVSSRDSWESGRLHGSASAQYGLTSFSLLDGTSTPRPEFSSVDGMSLTDPASCNMVSGSYADGAECFLELAEPGTADDFVVVLSPLQFLLIAIRLILTRACVQVTCQCVSHSCRCPTLSSTLIE